MVLRYYSFEEMYLLLKKTEKRGLSLEKTFLIATENSVTIEMFLNSLERLNFCSKYFIEKYFEIYYKRDKIHFFDDLLEFIMKNELFDEELSLECIRILFAKYFAKEDSLAKKESYLRNILNYAHSLHIDYAETFEEQFMDVSPLLYSSMGEIHQIPAYLINYRLFIEFEDENSMYEEHNGVAYSLSKRDEVSFILEDLENICEGLERDLILKLKNSLNL